MRVNQVMQACEEALGTPIVRDKWPPITVLVYTYDRPVKIRRVLVSLKKRLKYSGELIWRLADDGSPPGYLESIAADFPELELQWTVTNRKGFGANANKGYRARTTKYVLPTEDDLLIVRDIDLDTGIALMEGEPVIGALRYGAVVMDTILCGRVLLGKPPIAYFVFDRQRSKYWNPCGHPTLIQPDFYEAYGYLPEGVRVSEVELAWTGRTYKMPGPEVAILPQYIGRYPFVHLSADRLGGTERDAGYMIELEQTPQ